jgi:hypothetical protein
MRDKHGGNTATASTVRGMVREIFDRSPRPLHRSLRKCCAPRGATCPRGMNCAASAVAVMLSVNVLGHENGVPPTRVCTINW